MKQQNDFTEESRFLFSDAHRCWWCLMNKPDILHHIVGRGTKGSTVEKSPLNAALLHNYKCHLQKHNELRNEKNVKKLLNQTYIYLVNKQKYKLTELDAAFIEKYIKYYY